MGVGVQEVVEMYTTTLGEADTVPSKDVVVESTVGRRDLKRQYSEVSPSSPLDPPSPCIDQSKWAPLESLASPHTDLDSSKEDKESYESRRKRFLRTAEALRQSGLLDITMKTAELLRKNHELQREIESLQHETKQFVLSVLSNPENRHILDNIKSGAQLYEVVVPGSQGIMSVSTQRPDTTPLPSSTTTTTTPLSQPSSSPPSSSPSLSPSSSPSPSSSTDDDDPSSLSDDDDPSSLSDDNDTSEEENLAPPKSFIISSVTTKTKQ